MGKEHTLLKKTPQPTWIKKCRETVGRGMKAFFVDDGDRLWDVYKLTSVMHGYMEEAFAGPLALQHYNAKELLVIALIECVC